MNSQPNVGVLYQSQAFIAFGIGSYKALVGFARLPAERGMQDRISSRDCAPHPHGSFRLLAGQGFSEPVVR